MTLFPTKSIGNNKGWRILHICTSYLPDESNCLLLGSSVFLVSSEYLLVLLVSSEIRKKQVEQANIKKKQTIDREFDSPGRYEVQI